MFWPLEFLKFKLTFPNPQIHGLKAANTRFYSALKSQAFRHCDSVVKCGDKQKLVNAKYCENFAHVK